MEQEELVISNVVDGFGGISPIAVANGPAERISNKRCSVAP